VLPEEGSNLHFLLFVFPVSAGKKETKEKCKWLYYHSVDCCFFLINYMKSNKALISLCLPSFKKPIAFQLCEPLSVCCPMTHARETARGCGQMGEKRRKGRKKREILLNAFHQPSSHW